MGVPSSHGRAGRVGLADEHRGQGIHTSLDLPDLLDPREPLLVGRRRAICHPHLLELDQDGVEPRAYDGVGAGRLKDGGAVHL
jgi:hypothetical protein